MNKPWKNAEGYSDPTAYHGTKTVIQEEDERARRITAVIGIFRAVADLAGLDIINRVEFRDRRSGRTYR